MITVKCSASVNSKPGRPKITSDVLDHDDIKLRTADLQVLLRASRTTIHEWQHPEQGGASENWRARAWPLPAPDGRDPRPYWFSQTIRAYMKANPLPRYRQRLGEARTRLNELTDDTAGNDTVERRILIHEIRLLHNFIEALNRSTGKRA